ncbi:MAG TPA: phytochelatin synthase family protein [Lysobacter sp.]
MKRTFAAIALATALAATAAAGAVWNKYLRTPPVALLPLPAHLVALESPEGRRLLSQSEADADYEALRASFEPQTRRAYCGVASALVALNAAGTASAPLDQRALFAHPSVELHPLKVSFTGMSLRQFGALLRAHGAVATVVHASDTDIDAFRRTALANLAREGDFLFVNYERAHLGQQRMGHISPVAAYHAASDRLLVLDVAAHKYPPVWVPVDVLWEAMDAPLNERTTTTRGFVVVAAESPRTLAGETKAP